MPVTIDGSNTPTAGGVVYGDGTEYASTAAGTSGQLLQSNGASAPSWVAAPTTSPAGSNTQIQYNNSGSFGASSAFTFDGTTATTPRLALGGTTLPAAGTATLFSRSSDNNTYLQSGSGNTVILLDGSQNSMALFGSSTVQFLTGNTERFRIASAGQLGIGGANYGTSGQVLTSGGSGAAPTWSTPSAGALVYISTTTASGSANTFDITTGFSSTYDDYLIIGENIKLGVSGSESMNVRLYLGGALATSSYQYNRLTVFTAPSAGRSTSASFIETGTQFYTETTCSFGLYLRNTNSASSRVQGQINFTCSDNTNPDGNMQSQIVFGNTSTTSALSGIRLYWQTGTSTFAAGTLRLYGIAKS